MGFKVSSPASLPFAVLYSQLHFLQLLLLFCCRTHALVQLGKPFMQQHRVWHNNGAAFELSVQLMDSAVPVLAANGLWLAERMMWRDDGQR